MQKTMQQLDLFGMPIEPVATAPAKKSKPVAKQVQENTPTIEAAAPASMPEPVPAPVAIVEPAGVPVSPKPEEPVVFADERIVVKIKQRNTPPAVAAEPPPVQAPTKTVAETVNLATKQPGKRGRKSFKDIDNEVDLIEVPDEETLQQKLYYSISEVASWFKVNTSLLRYWENEFDVLKPRKTRKGDRLFRVEDIRNLQLIYFLLRQRKLSIEGARNYLRQHRQQADIQVQLVQSLTRFKSFLLELKAGL